MKIEEIELIIIKISALDEEIVNLKIYKNGTVCRNGVCNLPAISTAGMGFFNNSEIFDALTAQIPEEVVVKPLNYEEETPNGYTEWIVAFYGASTNGENGERAQWSKSTGVRIKLDNETQFNHPLIRLIDTISMSAIELTNPWYFDLFLLAVYQMRNSTMPETILALPKTKNEIKTDFENYLSQVNESPRRWSLSDFVKDKTYEKDGEIYHCNIQAEKSGYHINFTRENINSSIDHTKKKPWWKF